MCIISLRKSIQKRSSNKIEEHKDQKKNFALPSFASGCANVSIHKKLSLKWNEKPHSKLSCCIGIIGL